MNQSDTIGTFDMGHDAPSEPSAALFGGSGLGVGQSNFDGAVQSKDRTFIYYPHLDSEKAVNELTRGVLLRKSNWAYDNNGYVGGMVNTAARECGGMMPKSLSGDAAWDKLADEYFVQATESPEVFDTAGDVGFFELQERCFVEKFKSGDGAVVLVGDGTFPQIALRESGQISNAPVMPKGQDQEKWNQGLLLDRHGKAQKYRFVSGERFTDIDRQDVIFFKNQERIRQRRGLPYTYRLLNHLHDSNDIVRYMKAGVKSRNLLPLFFSGLETSSGTATVGDAIRKGFSSGSGVTAESDIPKRDELIDGPKIPRLPQGVEVKELKDDRPGPNQLNFLDWIRRDMSAGFGVPVEVIWNLESLSSANTRTVLRSFNGFVMRERKWFQTQIGRRLRNWIIAKGIKTGRLPMPQGNPFAHEWIGGALATADFAKDMRVMLEASNRGELASDELAAYRGVDREKMDRKHIATIAERMKACADAGVSFEYAFPKASGTATVVQEEVEPVVVPANKNQDDE